ncbi:MAG: antibiotic biosynthesis monooxygenase [Rhizobium sp.]
MVAGYVEVDPADLAELVRDLKALAIATRVRAGNISYDVAVDDPQTGRLLISERWANQPALSAHLESVDTVAFVKHW